MDGSGTPFTGYNTCTRAGRARPVITGGGMEGGLNGKLHHLCVSLHRRAGVLGRGGILPRAIPTVISIPGFVSASDARRVQFRVEGDSHAVRLYFTILRGVVQTIRSATD